MAVRRKRSISMRKEFTIRAGLAAVDQFERDHGAFSAAEIADSDEWAAQALERASAGTGRLVVDRRHTR